MDRASTSERTPLVRPPVTPTYVFSSSAARQRRHRLHKLQCFICSLMLIVFLLALILTISYNIEHSNDSDDNPTSADSSDANFTLMTLLAMSWPISDVKMENWSQTMVQDDLVQAGEAGAKALEDRTKFEEKATILPPGSPAFRAQMALGTALPSMNLTRSGYAKDYATKFFVDKQESNKQNWCVGKGPAINASWTPEQCIKNETIKCLKTKYRSINGTCNNLDHALEWGVSFTQFRRVIPPAYADGVLSPRRAHDGSELPSARKVSVQVHRPIYRADPQFTVMLAVWGQFLDHDITATALSKGANNSAISCCYAFKSSGLKPHPECFPVKIGPGDPNYDKYNITCMEFVRSAPAPSCNLEPREQFNQATAFIDASTIYGPYNELTNSLRTFKNGELRMMVTPDGRELLPASQDPNDGCNEVDLNNEGKYCFESGDIRANENLHLTTMHLLWARQHNKITRKLHQLNPNWTDETLFQEARRITASQMQHITYNEFLPVLLGPKFMENFELLPKSTGYYHGYNASTEPNIANNFASSAFRFAHTLLPTLMKVADSQSHSPEYIHLHKMLFNPYSLYNEGGADRAMRGAMQTDTQKVDPYFSSELTSHLFERDKPQVQSTAGSVLVSPCGLDLVSLNIQRGRDHGLPSYPTWRKHCGFEKPTSFNDLKDVMDPDSLYRISSIYKNIDDVDLYTAALSEVPIEGSILGATVTCLLLDQFVRLKSGDRFWYETPERPQAFTERQLDEIRKTTLAGIICSNGDSLEEAQKYVMRSVAHDNPLMRCSEHPELDLRLWTENPAPKVELSEAAGSTIAIIKGNT